jgi:D-alanine-D-alanine ligase
MAAEDGIYFLELNTLPGLTTSSLVPQELRVEGIEFRDFLERQIALGRERTTRARTTAAAR